MLPEYEVGDCVLILDQDNNQVQRTVIERNLGGGEFEIYVYILDDGSIIDQINIYGRCK